MNTMNQFRTVTHTFHKHVAAWALALGLVVGAGTSHAATYVWTSTAPSDVWQDANAWTPTGGPSGMYDNAFFTNAATYYVTLTNDVSISSNFFSNASNTLATVTLDLGTNLLKLFYNGEDPGAFVVGDGATSTTTVYLASSTVAGKGLYVPGRLIVGRSGVGTLFVTNGSVFVENRTTLGYDDGGRGTLVVSGPNTSWTNVEMFMIGNVSNSYGNAVVISNQAVVFVGGAFWLGSSDVGGGSSSNTLLLDSGAKLFCGSASWEPLIIGHRSDQATPSYNNTATVQGGAVWNVGGGPSFYIGLYPGGAPAAATGNVLTVMSSGVVTNIGMLTITTDNTLNLAGVVVQGGTITCSGTVQGFGTALVSSVTITNGGFFSPFNSLGPLVIGELSPSRDAMTTVEFGTSGDLLLASDATTTVELGTNFNTTVVGNNLTLNGTLNLTDSGGFTNGTYTLFNYGGTLTTNGTASILTIGTVPNTNWIYTVDISSIGYVNLNVVIPPPVANFSGSPTNGVAPLAVTFTDTSSGSITNWFWDFGDGNTTNFATATNPLYTYNAAGTYTVSLTVNGLGGSNTSTQTSYIVVGTCTYTLSSPGGTLGASGGSGSFTVNTPDSCAWTPSTTSGWIHPTGSGPGTGPVNFTLDANTSASSRSGTITVGGQTFTVNQSGIISCAYTISSSSTNVPATASGGSFGMTATSDCAWTASTTNTWIHTSSSGNGNGTVSYTVDANGSANARSGSIATGGQSFTVNQAGTSSCTYSISATSTNVVASAGSGSVGVTAGGGCSWTAVSSTNWLHTGSSGTGNGTVSYTVDGNTNTDQRSGTIVVQGQTFTVTQAGSPAQSLLVYLTASAVSTGQVNLSWSGGGSGVASYGVSRDGTQIATAGGANYSDDGLAAGTEYCYTVKAYDSAGNTLVQSAEACAQTFVTPGSLHGIYNGLVIQTNAPTHASSGSIKLVVSKTGSFSAHLAMGGVKAKFKGQFDASGNATNTVPRTGLDPLQAILHLDVTNGTDQITGTVSDNSVNVFTSELLADRAVFSHANPCPWADRYTVVLEPPEGDATNNIPQGYGYGTLTVTTSGGGKLRGVLGDGMKITCNVPVSKHATWPLYDALYKNQGACIGWVTFATNPTTNSILEATVDWFRPSMPTSAYYPAGFTTNVTLIGDKYVSPSAGGPSPAGDRQITLGVGNLVSNIVQAMSIDAAGNVTVSPPNSENLKMKLQLATGLFSGSFTHPSLETTINFRGAVLQPDSSGAGYFLGTNESGFVTFELPVP